MSRVALNLPPYETLIVDTDDPSWKTLLVSTVTCCSGEYYETVVWIFESNYHEYVYARTLSPGAEPFPVTQVLVRLMHEDICRDVLHGKLEFEPKTCDDDDDGDEPVRG